MGTGNSFQIKSSSKRAGVIEDIHFEVVKMDSSNAHLYTLNWNPTYSYSTLPKGYNYDSIPAQWKLMLHTIEPPEKVIHHFKDVYISNVKVLSHLQRIIC